MWEASLVRTSIARLCGKYDKPLCVGNEFIGDIELAPGLTIKGQSFGVATSSVNITELGVDGVLGYVVVIVEEPHLRLTTRVPVSIGPTNLTFGTLSPDSHSVIPTGKYHV